jgi:hypothetical protein
LSMEGTVWRDRGPRARACVQKMPANEGILCKARKRPGLVAGSPACGQCQKSLLIDGFCDFAAEGGEHGGEQALGSCNPARRPAA